MPLDAKVVRRARITTNTVRCARVAQRDCIAKRWQRNVKRVRMVTIRGIRSHAHRAQADIKWVPRQIHVIFVLLVSSEITEPRTRVLRVRLERSVMRARLRVLLATR